MEFQTVLENRRSVRSYDDSKKVTKEQINEIVEACLFIHISEPTRPY